MRRLWTIAGVLMVLMGGVWALQGANVLPGSVMTGQSFWLYAGIALAIAGLAVLAWTVPRRG